MTSVYVSSTGEDLAEHRRIAMEVVRRLGCELVGPHGPVGLGDWRLSERLRQLAGADCWIGLFAFSYGPVPADDEDNPRGASLAELEYRHVQECAGPRRLIYLLDEAAPWPARFNDAWTGRGNHGERIRRLREELASREGVTLFSTPEDLAGKIETALSAFASPRPAGAAAAREAWEDGDEPDGEPTLASRTDAAWDAGRLGPPYPGLARCTRAYAPVFFGRETETRELLERMARPQGRFVIVSGELGCGKSSLVEAGVLARLQRDGQGREGRGSVQSARMVPGLGADAFDALLKALAPLVERADLDLYRLGRDLAKRSASLTGILENILARGLDADGLVLFVDQMGKLFTSEVVDPRTRRRLLGGLYAATRDLPMQVVATIHSHELHHCYEDPDMLMVLKGLGHYPVGAPSPRMLREVIVRPARCAGVSVPDELAGRMSTDALALPAPLPALAFALRRLFTRGGGSAMTRDAYERLGGVANTLANFAADLEHGLAKRLGRERNEQLHDELFDALVQVDAQGQPTRRHVRLSELGRETEAVARILVKSGLLLEEGEEPAASVCVAHGSLFQYWPALGRWVAEQQDDLRLLRQAERDAAEWRRQRYDLAYLWHIERLKRLQAKIEELPAERVGEELRQFAWPQKLLIKLLEEIDLAHETREAIGQLLAALGDPRPGTGVRGRDTPDIYWVSVPGGGVSLEGEAGTAHVRGFEISRYPITNAQFQAFVDAADGYASPDWWQGMPANANNGPGIPRRTDPNRPRDTVSWYEAVAFCRWLSYRLETRVRLPTEFEWQQAATGGDPQGLYPWGSEWDPRRCNSEESGLGRPIAVGMYPAGESRQKVCDLSGNVWEWCLNKHDSPKDARIDDSGDWRVLRGGSCLNLRDRTLAQHRAENHPERRIGDNGFRVVTTSLVR